jgi:hypothetical protein
MDPAIDYKTDSREFQVELGTWKVSTTVALILLGRKDDAASEAADPTQFYIIWESTVETQKYFGHMPVSGNGSWRIAEHRAPTTTTLSVSDYSHDESNRQVSIHVNINYDVMGIGNIYDKTLAGRYGIDPWIEI